MTRSAGIRATCVTFPARTIEIMSKINGEKARAAITKRRRTAMRIKTRAARAETATAAAPADKAAAKTADKA
jgi:hypothetical protein